MERNEGVIIDFNKSDPGLFVVLPVEFVGGGVNTCVSVMIDVYFGLLVFARHRCGSGLGRL